MQQSSLNITGGLYSVNFINSNIGYTVGWDFVSSSGTSIILKTTNGGTTWVRQTTPINLYGTLESVYYYNNIVYVVGTDSNSNTLILKSN